MYDKRRPYVDDDDNKANYIISLNYMVKERES